MFMFKNTLRKIKHSLGRFITLILIIAIEQHFSPEFVKLHPI